MKKRAGATTSLVVTSTRQPCPRSTCYTPRASLTRFSAAMATSRDASARRRAPPSSSSLPLHAVPRSSRLNPRTRWSLDASLPTPPSSCACPATTRSPPHSRAPRRRVCSACTRASPRSRATTRTRPAFGGETEFPASARKRRRTPNAKPLRDGAFSACWRLAARATSGPSASAPARAFEPCRTMRLRTRTWSWSTATRTARAATWRRCGASSRASARFSREKGKTTPTRPEPRLYRGALGGDTRRISRLSQRTIHRESARAPRRLPRPSPRNRGTRVRAFGPRARAWRASALCPRISLRVQTKARARRDASPPLARAIPMRLRLSRRRGTHHRRPSCTSPSRRRW